MRVLLLNRVVSALACLVALSIWGCVSPGELDNKAAFQAALAGRSATTPTSGTGGAGAGRGGAGGGGAAGTGGVPASTAMGCANGCKILMDKCALCHGGPNGMGMGFDVGSPNIGMRLSNAEAKTTDCLGEKLIDTANPDKSVMYTKVTAAMPPRCGQLMPPTGAGTLTADEIECVRQWVAKPVCP
jgi:hypothetical protein